MRTGIILLVMLLMGCNKQELAPRPNSVIEDLPCELWTYNLGNVIVSHTEAWETMALSGSVSGLLKEYPGSKRGDRIPSGLGDNVTGLSHEGYASVIEIDGWRIAMYHPNYRGYKDNWIQYRISDGYWERWDLGHDDDRCVRLIKKGN